MNPIPLYTGGELASMLVPGVGERIHRHVAGPLNAIATWHADRGWNARLDQTDVVLEVQDMNLMRGTRERIVGRLEQATFGCEWILPEHGPEKPAFWSRWEQPRCAVARCAHARLLSTASLA